MKRKVDYWLIIPGGGRRFESREAAEEVRDRVAKTHDLWDLRVTHVHYAMDEVA